MQLVPRRIVATTLTVASVALAAAAPSAAISTQAAGDLVPTSATFSPEQVGENLVFGFQGTHTWTGSFTGTSTIVGDLVVRPSGPATFRGLVTFTGTTPCGPAIVQFLTTGDGELPFLTGRAVTIGAGSVHAELDVSLVLDPSRGAFVHYAGDVHCG